MSKHNNNTIFCCNFWKVTHVTSNSAPAKVAICHFSWLKWSEVKKFVYNFMRKESTTLNISIFNSQSYTTKLNQFPNVHERYSLNGVWLRKHKMHKREKPFLPHRRRPFWKNACVFLLGAKNTKVVYDIPTLMKSWQRVRTPN